MSSTTLSIRFYKKPSKNPPTFILFCQYSIADEQFEFGSTGVSFYRNEWDGERISSLDPESAVKNRQLVDLQQNLQAAYDSLLNSNVEYITGEKIKRAYLSRFTSSLDKVAETDQLLAADHRHTSLITVLTLYADTRKSLRCYRKQHAVERKLMVFLKKNKNEDILVRDFDYRWVVAFRNYLMGLKSKTKPERINKKGLRSYMTHLENVLRWAGIQGDIFLHLADADYFVNRTQDTPDSSQGISLQSIVDLYTNRKRVILPPHIRRSHLVSLRQNLHNFLLSKEKLSILVEDFDTDWANAFYDWLTEIPFPKRDRDYYKLWLDAHLNLLKAILTWAVNRKLITVNPIANLTYTSAETPPEIRRYTYRGDRLTDPTLVGQLCTAVLRPDGKCIRGKNGSMLVEFDGGRTATVIGRQLRKVKEGGEGE